ncbi:MAG: NADH:ubiquinone reductase (Na(+)-transporting) subunit C [Bacteroidales bacterium]|nr:NADH:ubiquinone reductase (Na(+)-transporting) subunit C [Bacteroidales bacterium]
MINKQSNVYTIIYIIILVVVVGTALAFTSLSLSGRQKENADIDKMRQILASVHITPAKADIIQAFNSHIVAQPVVNAQGQQVADDAFDVVVANEVKLADAERKLPVFECRLDDGSTKYILPVYGAGLWGPIWGYVALDSDGSTVYGAYFAHQGETPGLGAEIEKPAFCNQFEGKQLFKNGQFLPIAVLKAGLKPTNGEDYVDGVSGGTITSKGVSAMLSNCLQPYEPYLQSLRNK